MTVAELQLKLKTAFPDAEIEVQDLTGGGDHFSATIVSTVFERKLPLERHRMVYAALGTAMQSDIHALALATRTPREVKP